ncbi:hypothetical protein AAMO2058_000770400 [Amorphochlora amoebiformis]
MIVKAITDVTEDNEDNIPIEWETEMGACRRPRSIYALYITIFLYIAVNYPKGYYRCLRTRKKLRSKTAKGRAMETGGLWRLRGGCASAGEETDVNAIRTAISKVLDSDSPERLLRNSLDSSSVEKEHEERRNITESMVEILTSPNPVEAGGFTTSLPGQTALDAFKDAPVEDVKPPPLIPGTEEYKIFRERRKRKQEILNRSLPPPQLLKNITFSSPPPYFSTYPGTLTVKIVDEETPTAEQGLEAGDELLQIGGRWTVHDRWWIHFHRSKFPFNCTFKTRRKIKVPRGSEPELRFKRRRKKRDLNDWGMEREFEDVAIEIKKPINARFAVQAANGSEIKPTGLDTTITIGLTDARINKSDPMRISFAAVLSSPSEDIRCAEYTSRRLQNYTIRAGLLEPDPQTGETPSLPRCQRAMRDALNTINYEYLSGRRRQHAMLKPEERTPLDGCSIAMAWVINETLIVCNLGDNKALLGKETRENETIDSSPALFQFGATNLSDTRPKRGSGYVIGRDIVRRHDTSNLEELDRVKTAGYKVENGLLSGNLKMYNIKFTSGLGFLQFGRFIRTQGLVDPYFYSEELTPRCKWLLLGNPYMFRRTDDARLTRRLELALSENPKLSPEDKMKRFLVKSKSLIPHAPKKSAACIFIDLPGSSDITWIQAHGASPARNDRSNPPEGWVSSMLTKRMESESVLRAPSGGFDEARDDLFELGHMQPSDFLAELLKDGDLYGSLGTSVDHGLKIKLGSSYP